MRKLWVMIPFVLVAVVWLYGCDETLPTQPAEPAANADALFERTARGLVKDNLLFKATCAPGVTGIVRVMIGPRGDTRSLFCPRDEMIWPANGVRALHSDYIFLTGEGEGNSCAEVSRFVRDIPYRTRCTGNGSDAGGKSLATFSVRWVK